MYSNEENIPQAVSSHCRAFYNLYKFAKSWERVELNKLIEQAVTTAETG